MLRLPGFREPDPDDPIAAALSLWMAGGYGWTAVAYIDGAFTVSNGQIVVADPKKICWIEKGEE